MDTDSDTGQPSTLCAVPATSDAERAAAIIETLLESLHLTAIAARQLHDELDRLATDILPGGRVLIELVAVQQLVWLNRRLGERLRGLERVRDQIVA